MTVIMVAGRAMLLGSLVVFLAVSAHAADTAAPGTGTAAPSPGIAATGADTAAAPAPSTAAASASTAGPLTPGDDFANEYKQFKDELAALPKRIEETSIAVEGKASAAAAHQQLDALRALVSKALAQVVDNGPVAKIGQTALNVAQRKLDDLRQDTHYTKQQRDYLIKQWTENLRATSNAVDELEAARKELADLLKVLQSNDDFMGELEALNNATKTAEAVRDLSSGMREISVHLRLILQRMNGPNM